MADFYQSFWPILQSSLLRLKPTLRTETPYVSLYVGKTARSLSQRAFYTCTPLCSASDIDHTLILQTFRAQYVKEGVTAAFRDIVDIFHKRDPLSDMVDFSVHPASSSVEGRDRRVVSARVFPRCLDDRSQGSIIC